MPKSCNWSTILEIAGKTGIEPREMPLRRRRADENIIGRLVFVPGADSSRFHWKQIWGSSYGITSGTARL
jgi:hypothetical protein